MDARGWVTEFRCMKSNIALKQKILKDLGESDHSNGSHIRRNLKEIILVEILLEESGWLENPEIARDSLQTMDGKEDLSEELAQFWVMCGLNRDQGVVALSKNEVVQFKDVCVLKKDTDEQILELKTMIKNLAEMIVKISDENSLKGYISDNFNSDIKFNKKMSVVSNFYENVKQIIESQNKELVETEGVEEEVSEDEDDLE